MSDDDKAKPDEKGGPDRDAPESPAIDTDKDAARDSPETVPALAVVGDPSATDQVAAEAPESDDSTLSVVGDDPDAVDHIDAIEAVPQSGRSGKRGKKSVLDLPDDAPTPAQKEEVRRPGKGETEVLYLGLADLVEVGDYRFRPGQPVIVRSDVVEELLTMPNETFVVVKE